MTDSEPPSPDGAPTGVASASSRVEQARRFADFVRRYRGPLVQYFRKRGLVLRRPAPASGQEPLGDPSL